MDKKTTRANSAQNRTAKRVNNRCNSAEETCAAVVLENVEPQSQTDAAAVAGLPVATETKNGKVSSKDVLKAAGSLRAAVKEERRGANCTIRLIAERAASGDAAAVNILCALCDVPRNMLYSLNIDKVRAAVNDWYPYFTIIDEGGQYNCKVIKQRRVSVKPAGVWYSTAASDEAIEAAAKRVQRGYVAAPVSDYLDQLILAAKCRAKGVKPRRVDAEAVYSNIELSEVAEGITATEVDEAKKRKAYLSGAVNVWKKDRNGFYI